MRDSRNYEVFVQKVIEEFSDLKLVHQKEFKGRVSGRNIKVDLALDVVIVGGARLLVIIECKYYSRVVEVGDIEEFHSKLDDIGAHKGIVVSTVGFNLVRLL